MWGIEITPQKSELDLGLLCFQRDVFGEEDSWLHLYNLWSLAYRATKHSHGRIFINIYPLALGHIIRKKRRGKTVYCKAIKKICLGSRIPHVHIQDKFNIAYNYNPIIMRVGILYMGYLGDIEFFLAVKKSV